MLNDIGRIEVLSLSSVRSRSNEITTRRPYEKIHQGRNKAQNYDGAQFADW